MNQDQYWEDAYFWMCSYVGGFFGGLEKYPYLKDFRDDINALGIGIFLRGEELPSKGRVKEKEENSNKF